MNVLFAIAIYVGTGGVVSEALIAPTADNIVAALLAMIATTYTMQKRISENAMKDTNRALESARKQLAEQNILLRAMREALEADDLEPIRAFWRDRSN